MSKLIIGKVESINIGPHFSNATILLLDKSNRNLKIEKKLISELKLGKIYQFEVIEETKDEDLIFRSLSFDLAENVFTKAELSPLYEAFYEFAPVPVSEIIGGIESFINSIKNPIYQAITKELYGHYQGDFYHHPAATKFHHAYYGGLSFHTLTMLKLVKGFVQVYPYLDYDLLIAGIVLHDILKIDELTGVDGEYTIAGMLIGHIVQGTIEIEKAAIKLGFNETEEVLLLKHVVLAHHGQLNYGSPKKPQIPEALLVWYLDTLDSKLAVLGEELAKVKPGEFTAAIAVLDKQRYYKTKLKK